MSLPSAVTLLGLDVPSEGLPFAQLDVTGSLNLISMDIPDYGLPFVAINQNDPPILQYPARQVSLGRFIRARGRAIQIQHLR